jgi:membrane protein implicated in regulation of membrane protease activity
MRALSTEDGSAEAVREAAEIGLAQGDHRLALERELDRLNVAVQGSAAALGQHLSWLLVAQAFLLVAYMVVLVGGWSVPLPSKRGLLIGIAAFAALAVISTYLGLRAARDRVGPLKQHRQRVEDALERIAARPPAFARQGAITAILSQASTRGLPLLVCAGWGVLSLYALAVPMPAPNDARPAAAASEPRTNGSPGATAVAPAKPARSSSPVAKSTPIAPSEEPLAEASTNTNAPSGSPLVDFLRRAVNTPPAAEPQEPVKP